MIDWNHIIVAEEHQKDLLHQAENERLAAQLRAHPGRQHRLHRRVLIWIGRRLVTWGARLQAQYGAPASAITQRQVNQLH